MNEALESFLDKKAHRAEKWKSIIEEMLNDSEGSFDYADGTLEGILEYVEENDDISDAQIKAVENIREKPSQPYGRRRY